MNFYSVINGLSKCRATMTRDRHFCDYAKMVKHAGSNVVECMYIRTDIDGGCDNHKAQVAFEAVQPVPMEHRP